MTTEQTPKATASQEVEALIAHYQALQHKRKALIQAHENAQEESNIKRLRQKITDPVFIQHAIQKGVFVNYSRSDDVFALELAVHLHDMGIKVWMDTINIEADWDQEVERAMAACGLMISILSPHALTDPLAGEERQRFQKMGKLVMPIMSEPCEIPQAQFLLPVIDFSRGFDTGFARLRHYLPATREAATV